MASDRQNAALPPQPTYAPAGINAPGETTGNAGAPPLPDRPGEPAGAPNVRNTANLGQTHDAATHPNLQHQHQYGTETGAHGTTAGLGGGTTKDAAGYPPPQHATETGEYGPTAGEGKFTPGDAHGRNTGASIGKEIRGVFAQGHGIGETIRGNFNAALDSLAGNKEGEAKNAAIANKGEREFTNKEFEHGSGGKHV